MNVGVGGGERPNISLELYATFLKHKIEILTYFVLKWLLLMAFGIYFCPSVICGSARFLNLMKQDLCHHHHHHTHKHLATGADLENPKSKSYRVLYI